jgi:hypothetical protein
VKTAQPSGRMRGEMPKKGWERDEPGKKYTGTWRCLWGNESSPVMWPGPPTGRVAVGQCVGELGEWFGAKEGGEGGKVGHLDQDACAS